MNAVYQPGKRIDRYEIQRLIGTGGFGATYLATDTGTGGLVVLKLANEVMLGDQTVFEHFRRERLVCRQLVHPNIVRALDDGSNRSLPYLALEYVEGDSLHDQLRERGRLTVEEAVAIGRQVAAALAYMHERHVYHRDLKPGNILITPAGQVKIIDFGLALMEGARRVTWQMLTNAAGTPHYMAPEQIIGKRGDARTDIYACGIVMYELLKGRPPYDGPADEPTAIMQQHLSGLVDELPPHVPAGLRGIVQKCMRRDPAERYQSAGELIADLDRYEQLTATDFQFAEERAQRMPNPEGRLIALAGMMALAFIGIVAVIIGVVVVAQ